MCLIKGLLSCLLDSRPLISNTISTIKNVEVGDPKPHLLLMLAYFHVLFYPLQDKPTFSFSGLNVFFLKDLSQGEVKEFSPKLLQSTQFYFRKLNFEQNYFIFVSSFSCSVIEKLP